jgi:chromosomal replication initiator protein
LTQSDFDGFLVFRNNNIMCGSPVLRIRTEAIFEALKQKVSSVVFRNWIKPLVVHQSDHQEICFLACNEFHAERIKKHYLSLLEQVVSEIYGSLKITVHVSQQVLPLSREPGVQNSPENREIPLQTSGGTQGPLALPRAKESVCHFTPPPHSLENQLLIKIIDDFKKHPHQYDTLFLYGPPGSGKTTYAQYIFKCLNLEMGLSSVFLNIDEFTSELVMSLQSQSISKFRSKFKEKYKAIVMDDFHLILKRNKTQEELAYMLQIWKSMNIKVFLISQNSLEDSVSNEILKARLQSGLVLPVKPPDFECIEQIIAHELTQLNTQIKHWVLSCCANRISSLHTLKGILNRIRVEVGLCQRAFCQKDIEKIVEEFLPTHRINKPVDQDPENILDLVSQFYRINKHEISSKSRRKTLNESRKVCIFLLRHWTQLSLMDIGSLVGRDHTTVLHALQKFEEELKFSASLQRHIRFFQERLNTYMHPKSDQPHKPSTDSTVTGLDSETLQATVH